MGGLVDHERQLLARARELPRRREVRLLDRRIGDEQIVESERREEPRLLDGEAHDAANVGAADLGDARQQIRDAQRLRRRPERLPVRARDPDETTHVRVEHVEVDDHRRQPLAREQALQQHVVPRRSACHRHRRRDIARLGRGSATFGVPRSGVIPVVLRPASV